jgi:hypothetical protein
MSNRKLGKTLQQEKNDVLKLYLLSQAFDAKQYYSSGDFSNQLAKQVSGVVIPQEKLFQQISIIGDMLSSDALLISTAFGETQRNKLYKSLSEFNTSLNTNMQKGLITTQNFVNLKGYAQNVLGNTLTLIESTNGGANGRAFQLLLKAGIPQEIYKLISNPFQGMPAQQILQSIQNIPQPLGVSPFGIATTMAPIIQNQNIVPNVASNIPVPSNIPTRNIQTPAIDSILSIPPPPLIQPSQPGALASQTGEETSDITSIQRYNMGYNNNLFEGQHPIDRQRAIDYERSQRENKAYTGTTENYGMPIEESSKFIQSLKKFIDQAVNRDAEPMQILSAINKDIADKEKIYPKLETERLKQHLMKYLSERSAESNKQKIETDNAKNSQKGQISEKDSTAMQNAQNVESGMATALPVPKHTRDAQIDASIGRLNNDEALINTLSSNSNNVSTAFINFVLGFYRSKKRWTAPMNLVMMDGQIVDLTLSLRTKLESEGKNLWVLQYEATIEYLVKTMVETYVRSNLNVGEEYMKIIDLIDPSKSIENVAVQTTKNLNANNLRAVWAPFVWDQLRKNAENRAIGKLKFTEEIKYKLARAFDNGYEATKKSVQDLPRIWGFKNLLDRTTPSVPITSVFKFFVSKWVREKLEGKGRTRKALIVQKAYRKVIEQQAPAVGAKTSMVSQTANQYSVGNSRYIA